MVLLARTITCQDPSSWLKRLLSTVWIHLKQTILYLCGKQHRGGSAEALPLQQNLSARYPFLLQGATITDRTVECGFFGCGFSGEQGVVHRNLTNKTALRNGTKKNETKKEHHTTSSKLVNLWTCHPKKLLNRCHFEPESETTYWEVIIEESPHLMSHY